MTNRGRKNGDRELASTVHWRRIKNVANEVMKRCKGDLSKYDSENICTYSAAGCELQGYNVKYEGLDASCFVYDNDYSIFEFRSNDQKYAACPDYEGEYFVLAQNKSFDYWLALKMTYTIDYKKTEETGILYDNVTYRPLGQYDVRIFDTNTSKVDITLTKKAAEMAVDYSTPKYSNFDANNGRKTAYHTSTARIVAGIKHQPYSKNAIVGGKTVKKFKKK